MASKLNLTPRARRRLSVVPDTTHCTEILVGDRYEDFPFPSADVLVENGVKKAERKNGRRRKKNDAGDKPNDESDKVLFRPGLPFGRIITVLPQGHTEESYKPGKTLVAGAAAQQFLMVQRQYDGLMAERFGRFTAAVDWAKGNMEAKYQAPVVLSLEKQLTQLQVTYQDALPKLAKELAARNPGVPMSAVFQKAVELIDEELRQILFVLRFYTDAFEQYQKPDFARRLKVINFFFEQVFGLFAANLPTSAFQAGDLILSRYTQLSLGTVPGSRGPLRAHALGIPYEMWDVIGLNFPLLAHESEHNFFHDAKGLEAEVMAIIKSGIEDAYSRGRLKLSSKTVKVGRYSVPTHELLIKLITDCIGEIDADAAALLATGPSFLKAMTTSFPAMMRVSDEKKLLRTDSVFMLEKQNDGSTALVFEEHPQDWIRVHLGAANLDVMAFNSDADYFRELADFAVSELPDVLTWRDASGRSSAVIELPAEDFKAAAPVVAEALLAKPFKSLGNRTRQDCFTWTARRQEKALMIRDLLIARNTDLPVDQGDIFSNYVAAGAAEAAWSAMNDGDIAPEKAVALCRDLNDDTFAMLEKLQARTAASKK